MTPSFRSVQPAVRLRAHGRARSRGMTLIELLVAMVIMTIGIVGLLTLMARASQATTGAEDSQRAAVLAADLSNDMWAYSSINPPTLAAWTTRVATVSQSGLRNARGTVQVNGQVARITIAWTTPAGAARQYFTDVRLN